MLFVDWIFVAPKLKVRFDRLVSPQINHLETYGRRLPTSNRTSGWINLVSSLAPVVCHSHLRFTFVYHACVVVTC